MAMYYQGSSEIQASDGLQTLYLMNPNFVGYSDTQPNMLFLNSAAATHSLNSSLMLHAPPQKLLGVPPSHDLSRPSPVLDRFHYDTWGLADTNMAQQQTPRGLSLTLSAHQNKPVNSPVIGPMNNPSSSSPSATVTDQSSGVNAMRSFVIGSKYLEAAQKLLDDVVNVGKRKIDRSESCRDKAKMIRDSVVTNNGGSGNRSVVTELTTAQRQEIQMKKAKLNSMLDEVEQRCRHYHNEMQMVVASFEQAAGIGSARTYTQLALKTILKQFKCLKSTISAQIKELNNSLGEQDITEKKLETSRLDQQQRTLTLQNSAWRPQRGLPERAVSVLRAWLFQHFLHPYPKDSDKHMLAKQAGLTRSQVSNWFINARVRLWKPMVEEMYQEETQNQEHMDIPSKVGQENNRLMDSSLTEISPTRSSFEARAGFAELINSFNLPEKNPKKPRNATQDDIVSAEMEIKDANINRYHGHGMDRFSGADQQLEIGFQGNNFSLTLELPPTETSHTHHQNFLSHRNFDFGTKNVETGRVNSGIDFQNRKPFPAQLLPDFVA